ncbi:hypothetical protein TKK_0014202 [Trichogramma kaykai]|uniref:Uncharacterized protein n=1 Tax=Trichogramma kaykai TaxID=54128 RepID=A0ABD2WG09_9HYME
MGTKESSKNLTECKINIALQSSEGRGMQLPLDREDDSHDDPDCCILALPESPNVSARESALDGSLAETPDRAAAAAAAAAKERTSLVLDLRATSHFLQDNETLSWHALTLEPIPSSRRSSELALSTGRSSSLLGPAGSKKTAAGSSLRRQRLCQTAASSSPVRSVPIIEVSDAASTRSAPTNLGRRQDDFDDGDDGDEDEEEDSAPDEVGAGGPSGALQPMRRRGKLRRKKRKCRRGSIYGQQTEVRELPDPLETQVSQCDDESNRPPVASKLDDSKQGSIDKDTLPPLKRELPPSFLPPDVIKALSRELDQETVEGEFNAKRRYALEETLRVTGGYEARAATAAATSSSSSLAAAAAAGLVGTWPPRPNPILQNTQNVARLFYRQSARFQLLDSRSLVGLRPLDYLSEHVHISDARRLCYGRAFNKHKDETLTGPRYLLASVLPEALHDVLGREISASEQAFIEQTCLEPDTERLEFRVWCGLCAFAERLLPQLPPRDQDPPAWLERADFEMLDRRIAAVKLDPKLVQLLRLIRDS